MIAVSALRPYANNARTHSRRQIKKIAASIEQFGFLNPVLIDEGHQIIAGHGRVEAAKQLGWNAAEHAVEYLKQIITLSSGILALSATFLANGAMSSWHEFIFLLLAWTALALAVFFSLQTISAIIKSGINTDFAWHENPGKRTASMAKYTFIAGLVLFVIAAVDSGTNQSEKILESPMVIHIG